MKKAYLVLSGLAILSICSGCGLDTTVRVASPEISYPFTVDIDLIKSAIENQFQVDLGDQEEFPEGIEVNAYFEVKTSIFKEDLASKYPSLKAKIDDGSIESFEIKKIEYSVDTNTVNYDIPTIDLYIGDYDQTDVEQFVKIAEIPEIKVGFTGFDEVKITSHETLVNYVMKMKLAFVGKTGLDIDTSVNKKIPAGVISGEVKMRFDAIVNPI